MASHEPSARSPPTMTFSYHSGNLSLACSSVYLVSLHFFDRSTCCSGGRKSFSSSSEKGCVLTANALTVPPSFVLPPMTRNPWLMP